ncbi:MAG TPA: glycoside hydrolase family 9 protein [Polyangiaceae bacterium]|jgi:hypothetical protein
MKRTLIFVALGAVAFACGPSGGGDNPDAGGADASADAPPDVPSLPNANGGDLPPGYPNLDLPAIGTTSMRVLSPTMIELEKITTKAADPAPLTEWDFASAMPDASSFAVHVGSATASVGQVGFKRRPLYAPVGHYDLRIRNDLELVLAAPITDGASVTVDFGTDHFAATADPARFSPAIHANQTGYEATLPKHAFVGYYLGSLGELDPNATTFSLVDAATGASVFQGALTARIDQGFSFSPPQYQRVLEADFSAFQTPGEYQIQVAGLGRSYPFYVTDGVAMAFARTYAEGMFNQRCGMAKSAPFTKFVDGADHTAPASVPTGDSSYDYAAQLLGSNAHVPQGQIAPELTNFTTSLYPYVTEGTLDVAGGHHDAGDYSKYLMDSGFLIHTLVFAADNFDGVADLDNLGIPESGDGKSDVLQEAKWEADFAAKMQDADGLFYYLVYPRNRAYENDVLPSHGDPQIVWPKNTYASAAATAALAEIGSSPRFKAEFPSDAARYLQIAKTGWNALQKAVSEHGKEGAYQFIYQDDNFLHDDMIAWAASALFAATGDATYQSALEQWYPDPGDGNTYQWGWWKMWRGFGNAARTYAFAARSGRLSSNQLDAGYLAKCEAEVTGAGDDQATWAAHSAYGTSLPDPTKATDQAGWYFSGTQAFDLAVANALSPKPAYVDAIVTNLGYEGGANPVNVSYLAGLGWQRVREAVSQFMENDRHRLPPTGIDRGNVATGFMWLDPYDAELGALTFPSDGAQSGAYAFYDRFAHDFDTSTESDTVNEGWGFAAAVALAAKTNAAKTPWIARSATIAAPATTSASKPVTVTLSSPDGIDLADARVTWEAAGQEPFAGGTSFTFTPAAGSIWIDAEAMLPDGRRLVAATTIIAN